MSLAKHGSFHVVRSFDRRKRLEKLEASQGCVREQVDQCGLIGFPNELEYHAGSTSLVPSRESPGCMSPWLRWDRKCGNGAPPRAGAARYLVSTKIKGGQEIYGFQLVEGQPTTHVGHNTLAFLGWTNDPLPRNLAQQAGPKDASNAHIYAEFAVDQSMRPSQNSVVLGCAIVQGDIKLELKLVPAIMVDHPWPLGGAGTDSGRLSEDISVGAIWSIWMTLLRSPLGLRVGSRDIVAIHHKAARQKARKPPKRPQKDGISQKGESFSPSIWSCEDQRPQRWGIKEKRWEASPLVFGCVRGGLVVCVAEGAEMADDVGSQIDAEDCLIIQKVGDLAFIKAR
ncbi:hypothetical protein FB451DRAFT_1507854 [Mycena latifolia]|nr:hypothetical protein FB451DRAFT_1507854 [Mycena latifolia]